MGREAALEEAGPHRLRPILMTSAVLIFSMLPVAMALSDSSSGRAPLGAVLVGGMATSTLLSLLYVPVAYTYFDSLSKLGGKLFSWQPWTLWRRDRSDGDEPMPYPVAGGGVSAVEERLHSLRGRRRGQPQRPALA
jgi:hypothetical protein